MNLITNNRHFIVYTIIGASCEIIDFSLFYVLTRYADMDVLYSHLISVNAGLVCSFFINAKVNFRTSNRMFHRLFLFFAIAWVGLAFSSALLVFMVDYMGLYDVGSKIFTILLAGLYQYLLNKRFTYRIIKTKESL